ncbi:putative RNA-directed DNA polymerase [Helianthus annuus]|nr:putative RNA-directed DNA polymerase [Helianthus annuus]
MATSSNSNSSSNMTDFTSNSTQTLPNITSFMPVKLDNDNFLNWQHQALNILRTLGLLHFLNKEIAPPDETEARETWNRSDGYVSAFLTASLSPNLLHLARGTTSASDLWHKLEESFTQQVFAKQNLLRTQFHLLKQEDKSISDYCDSARTIYDSLVAIGDSISEHSLVLQILNGLHTDYQMFITNIENSDYKPNYSQLRAKLLTHEARLKQQQAQISPIAPIAAMTAMNLNSSNPPHSNSQSVTICQICDKVGHRASNCYYRFTPVTQNSQNSNSGGRYGNNGGRWRGNRGRYGGRHGGGGRSGRWSNGDTQRQFSAHMANFDWSRVPMNGNGSLTHSGNFDSRIFGQEFSGSGPRAFNLPTGVTGLSTQAGILGPNPNVTQGNQNQFTSNFGPSLGQQSAPPDQQTFGPHFGPDHFAQWASHTASPHFGLTADLSSICERVDSWVPDSGATAHMTADHSLVFGSVPYTGSERVVTLAGQLLHHTRASPHQLFSLFAAPTVSRDTWHSRLGHPCDVVMSRLSFLHLANKNVDKHCTACNVSKSTRLPFHAIISHSTVPLHVIHCDIWGPSPVVSRTGYRYFITFIDDFSRFTWIYPLTHRSQAIDSFRHFKPLVENLFSCTIKYLQCDGAPELIHGPMAKFLSDSGVGYRISCPYTPQQNGVAERKNRHLSEVARALLFHAHLPKRFWYDAYATAAFLINRLPSQILHHSSPYEVIFGSRPDYSILRTFGCLCYPFLGDTREDKLSPKSIPCIFVGYAPSHLGYLCYDPHSSRTYTSRHVRFYETVFDIPGSSSSSVSSSSSSLDPPFCIPPPSSVPTSFTPISSVSPISHTHSSSPSSPPSSPSSPPPPPPPLVPTHPMVTRSRDHTIQPRQFPDHVLYQASTAPTTEPSTFRQAQQWSVWWDAMRSEMSALHSNKTWVLVPAPTDANIVGCKWVYRIKHNPDGSVSRYKARLVAKGFHQTEGIDYTETFSPVVKPTTIRLVLSVAFTRGWTIRQVDVNNAFLHGDLSETVYMSQPPGFVDSSHPHHVCLLQKALYGLKQAPRAWFSKLSSALITDGFIQCLSDTSLFVYSRDSVICYVLVYVDDIIITGSSSAYVTGLIERLHSQFALKDLGALSYFLGVQATFHEDTLHLSQQRYLCDLLQRTGLAECRPLSTPVSSGRQLSRHSGDPLSDPTLYRSTVGALQYLVLTRPEIAYAVSKVSQFLQTPTDRHWVAVKRILRYLRGTISHGLCIRRSDVFDLHAYSDADWAGCPDDRRSTTGYCIFLGPNLISWSSKKQHTVARSSTEAEYRALAHTAAEIRWIISVLQELHVSLSGPPTLWCDNIGATYLAVNPVFHQRTKHLEIDLHFIRDMVLAQTLRVRYVPTTLQLADLLTKGLSSVRFDTLRSKLHVAAHCSA